MTSELNEEGVRSSDVKLPSEADLVELRQSLIDEPEPEGKHFLITTCQRISETPDIGILWQLAANSASIQLVYNEILNDPELNDVPKGQHQVELVPQCELRPLCSVATEVRQSQHTQSPRWWAP
jgi:hypothetical protein